MPVITVGRAYGRKSDALQLPPESSSRHHAKQLQRNVEVLRMPNYKQKRVKVKADTIQSPILHRNL